MISDIMFDLGKRNESFDSDVTISRVPVGLQGWTTHLTSENLSPHRTSMYEIPSDIAYLDFSVT